MKVIENNLPIKILGTGTSLPSNPPVSNIDILKLLPENKQLSDLELEKKSKDLKERYGFSQRYMVRMPEIHTIPDDIKNKEETSEDLSLKACKHAIAQTNEMAIEAFIHGTTTTRRYTGSQSTSILGKCNSKAPAFEIKAGCSTSLVSLHAAWGILSLGYDNVLVSCAETESKVINPQMPATYYILADGGAAVWIEKNETEPDFVIIKSMYGTDGTLVNLFTTRGTLPPLKSHIDSLGYVLSGDGKRMKMEAINAYKKMIETMLPDESSRKHIKWIIPHQINKSIIDEACMLTGLSGEYIWDSFDIGNIGGASVLYSLAKAIKDNKFVSGDEILLMSVGGGLSYAIQHWIKK